MCSESTPTSVISLDSLPSRLFVCRSPPVSCSRTRRQDLRILVRSYYFCYLSCKLYHQASTSCASFRLRSQAGIKLLEARLKPGRPELQNAPLTWPVCLRNSAVVCGPAGSWVNSRACLFRAHLYPIFFLPLI